MQAFLERQSPAVASVLLHALLLLFLWTQVEVRPIEPPRPEPIEMQIVLPPQPESSAGAGRPEAQPDLSQVQRTSANPAEQPTPEVPAQPQATEEAKEEETAKPNEQKPEPTPPEPTPVPATTAEEKPAKTPLDPQTIEQFRAQQEKIQQDLEARKSRVMTQVSGFAPAQGPGVKRPYSSAGSDRGVIRELDISKFPVEMQERFKARYGITIQVRRVEGGSPQSYVNAVTTDHGTYLSSGGSGVFEVMTLSKKVLARIAELEEQELRKRNLDPLRSRVIEVVFGLREDDRGLVDLVITRFRAEPIQ